LAIPSFAAIILVAVVGIVLAVATLTAVELVAVVCWRSGGCGSRGDSIHWCSKNYTGTKPEDCKKQI